MSTKRPSIRVRLLTVALISIVATLAVAGFSLVSVFERQLLKRVEQELDVRWTELAASFELDANGNPTLLRPLTDPRYHRPYSGAYWQIAEADGTVVLTSRSLWDDTLKLSDRSGTDPDSAAFETPGPGVSTLYVISRRVSPDGERRFDLTVAFDHAEVDALRQEFERDVLWILGAIAFVLALTAWFQLRHSLNPLRYLDRELKAVHEGRQLRLGSGFAREVEPVVSDLNRLLDRQEQLICKARDRAGALAHGLKTPLTIIGAEVRRLERQRLGESASKIGGQVEAIRRHVDRELARARTAGAAAAAGTYTNVGETVDRLLRLMQYLPRGDAISWEEEIPEGLSVRIDAGDFGEVVGNLLDNARKWARSRVTVRAETRGGEAAIVVEDDGPGFDPGDASPRKEKERSKLAGEESSGLGLGIVRDILSEYDIELQVDRIDGGCRISFTAPIGHSSNVVAIDSFAAERASVHAAKLAAASSRARSVSAE
jgi:signal transduction histidine kinase